MMPRAQPAGGSIVVVLSDLHVGAGRFPAGNTLEDFASDEAFAALLNELARESESAGRDADLVLNGDFVEFLQVPRLPQFDPSRSYFAAEYSDMSPGASAQRLQHVIEGHPAVFAALRQWVREETPQRRLIILRGNHDPHWYWSTVQEVMREATNASGARRRLVVFPALGWQAGSAYIEHGNQLAEAENRFANMEEPLAKGDPSQLETPWGSKFVIEFFNAVERHKYWVDSVTPYPALIWYALAYDPAFALRTLAALLRAAPRLIGVRDEVRDAWLTNIESDPSFAAMRYRTSAAYRAEVHALVAHALDEVEPGLQSLEALEMTGDEDTCRVGAQMQEAQDRRLIDGATRLAQEHSAQVVLLGHTHRPLDIELRTGARYLNTGCWVWQMDMAGASDSQWRELFARPDAFAAMRRLTYARIDFDADGAATAALRQWTATPAVDRALRRRNLLQRLLDWLRGRLRTAP